MTWEEGSLALPLMLYHFTSVMILDPYISYDIHKDSAVLEADNGVQLKNG